MKISNKLRTIGWLTVYAVLAINMILLYLIRENSITGAPIEWLSSNKPVLLIILDEFECATCVENLQILNELSEQGDIKDRIDFHCLIVSKTKSDLKKIATFFSFPVSITDDFKIFRRLNINRTPLLLGLSPQKQIVYSEFIPPSTITSENYLKQGILDRLFYSEFMNVN